MGTGIHGSGPPRKPRKLVPTKFKPSTVYIIVLASLEIQPYHFLFFKVSLQFPRISKFQKFVT